MAKEKPIVVITGAGRGIGAAIAQAFAAQKASLYLIARSRNELENVAKPLEKHASQVFILPADLTNPEEIDQIVDRIKHDSDHLDVLVNNAGMLKVAPLSETSAAVWENTLRINLTAPFLLTKSLLPLLKKSKRPHIFNVSSIAGKVPFPGSSAYCASKAGLLGLNGVMREEFREFGIRVSAVLPGPTNTKMFDEIPGQFDRKQFVTPQDIAVAITSAYLLSPNANVDEIQISSLQHI